MNLPSVGRIVHYVSYGTPGGEFPQACRAAIVTEVKIRPLGTMEDLVLGLCVLNPTGQFFNTGVPEDQGTPNPDEQGTELCYGYDFEGGTWHWPQKI